MSPELINNRLKAGSDMACIVMHKGRSALAVVTGVDITGKIEYSIAGVCPRAPILN